MKIEQLLKREPFGDIIEKTLAGFLCDYLGKPYRVIWRASSLPDRLSRKQSSTAGSRFFCNPYLNILFPDHFESTVVDFVRSNYLHTPFRHRRLLQRLYVTAATSRRSFRLFTTHVLEIQPRLAASSSLAILGGNNRIRIIDFQKMRTWDILKSGFDPVYMASELAVRRTEGNWPFPHVYKASDDGSWFESDYVPAVSSNRLASGDDDQQLLTEAFAFLGVWLERSRTSSPLEDYFQHLLQEVDSACCRRPILAPFTTVIRQFLDAAAKLLNDLQSDGPLPIDLAVGHGDFQQGNILLDQRRGMWIVDWEHSGQRQLAYDYLVFTLRSRFPSGLAERIQAAVRHPGTMLSRLPSVHEQVRRAMMEAKTRAATLLIFLLEELAWNLKENSNPHFMKTSGALPQLIAEAGPALGQLHTRAANAAW